MLHVFLLALFATSAAASATGSPDAANRPGSNFRLSFGLGKSDLGAAYRAGLEAEIPKTDSWLVGGRLAYGHDWRALGRFRTSVVTEPALYYALHGGPMSLLVGAGAGIAYVEQGSDAPCNGPAACASAPTSTTGTALSLSACAGSYFRIGPVVLSLLVRIETVSLPGYTLTLNAGAGLTLPR